LGIGDWAQSPIPNPQSPIPNPQSPMIKLNINNIFIILLIIIKYFFVLFYFFIKNMGIMGW